MNLDEELSALAKLAKDETVPHYYSMTIRCECGDAVSGISDTNLGIAKLWAARSALDECWHFDEKTGKALCAKCWIVREVTE